MNTAERTQKRQALIAEGFHRTRCSDDLAGTGAYTETWTHADGTTVTIDWAPRTTDASGSDEERSNPWRTALRKVVDSAEPVTPVEDWSGSMTPQMLQRIDTEVKALVASGAVPAERLLALAADLETRKAHPGAFYEEAIAYAEGEESAWQGLAETLRDLVAEFTPTLYCPHCGHAGLTGSVGERSCVDCYWQEGDDPEHPVPLTAPKGAN